MKSSNLTKYLRGGAAVLFFMLPAAAYAAPVGGVAKALADPVRAGATIERWLTGVARGATVRGIAGEAPSVRASGSTDTDMTMAPRAPSFIRPDRRPGGRPWT
jgi:hypothetical protein